MAATMFPRVPRQGTKSPAEIMLFNELNEKLPPTYQVHHSVAWQIRDQKSGVSDGEADFIIIDPNGSMMVLEVKGGKNIKYDSKTDQWLSNGHEIKDPYQQSRNAKYSLLQKLKENYGNRVFFSIGNAVAFPEVEIELADVRLDAPRDITLDISDLNKLENWVENFFRILTSTTRNQNTIVSAQILEDLNNVFSPSIEFSQPITSYFEDVNPVIKELTEEQFRLIDFLPRQRRASIYGCAGSGKTLVAIEKAIRLAQENFRVLILCHNAFLAQYIQNVVKGKGIAVIDFTTLVHFLVANHLNPQFSLSNIQEQKFLPWTQYSDPSITDLRKAYDQLLFCKDRFDAVIVDEGQDFKENWWPVVETCLSDRPNGIFYIFYDDNQAIYMSSGLQSNFPVPDSGYWLSRNCRNAGKIFDLVKQLHPDAPETELRLAGKGIVQELFFPTQVGPFVDQNIFLTQLEKAMLHAEGYFPKLKNLVVMTETINNSGLNGFVVDSIKIRNLKTKGHINWQQEVLDLLRPLGFSSHNLSKNLAPTKEDIKAINTFAKNRLFQRSLKASPKNFLDTMHWIVDRFGKVCLVWDRNHIQKLSDKEILSFFGQSNWASSFPSNHMRYRLTIEEDLEKYPNFYNVKLVDIPSFKGLEADGVIFVWEEFVPRSIEQLRANLYVALSRAKLLLFIVSPYSIKEKIEEINSQSIF